MTGPNPYAPPEHGPERPPRSVRRPLAILGRCLAVCCGFSILAGPIRPVLGDIALPERVAFKAFGALLLVGAFVPFGRRAGKFEATDRAVEEL